MIGRISSRSAFQTVRRLGRHVRSGPLSCTMLADSTLSGPRVGYALGRGFGTAVQRNRLRRQLRELVKTRSAMMAPGYYVFGASPRAKEADFSSLASALDRLLTKCADGSTEQSSAKGIRS